MKKVIHALLVLPLLAVPKEAQAQYTVTTNAGGSSVSITKYSGPGGAVTIPTNINNLPVTAIGNYAFDGCTNLVGVTIPDSVTSIGNYAFSGCGLTSVNLPGSVTSLGLIPFSDCPVLTAITVDPQNPSYRSVNGVLFDAAQATLVEYPNGASGSYTIPSSVTSIGDRAFQGATSLTNVTIPNNVTSIAEMAFFGSGLTSMNIASNVTSLGQAVFDDCGNLNSVTISGSVSSIAFSTFFNCSNLTSVILGNGITSIGQDAFFQCTGLTTIILPSSITNIQLAFTLCTNLTSALFTGNAPSSSADAFIGDNTTVYYLPGTTNWGSSLGDAPALLWNPVIQTADGSFGVSNNQFGFYITGTGNIPIVVEACTNLANPVWMPLTNVALTNGLFYFSDPQWTNYPARYYGIGFP
jgi:hypothetical protein